MFAYLSHKFSELSTEKLGRYFRWAQIRELIKDPIYVESVNELEKGTWKSFVLVI